MANLQQVAELAGVSKATVSRVINNISNVSRETQMKVTEAMKQLNTNAAELARPKNDSKMIGIVLPMGSPPLSEPFKLEILVGAEQKSMEKDYLIVVGNSKSNQLTEADLINRMIERNVEGIVLLSKATDGTELFEIHKNKCPIVLVDWDLPVAKMDCVRVDNVSGSRNLMNHLFDLGHEHIAIIYDDRQFSLRERLRGYQLAMIEQNITLKQELQVLIHPQKVNDVPGYEEALMLLSVNPRPTAIFITAPFMIMGVVQAVHEKGLRIPEDISIVVFDDAYTSLPQDYSNYFTSIQQNAVQVGSFAVEVLFQRKQNPQLSQQEILLPGNMLIRQSTAPVLTHI